MAPKRFSERMGEVVRKVLSCCDREDDEPERPALQIVSSRPRQSEPARPASPQNHMLTRDTAIQSGPTDFRREDISIPGLDEEQYAISSPVGLMT